MSRLSLTGFLAGMLVFTGCSNSIDGRAEHQGFLVDMLQNSDDSSRRYSRFSPGYASKFKLPLIVFLNGLGQNGDDGLSLKSNFGPQVWEMQRNFPFMIIAPQCSVGGSWTPSTADTQRALAIIDETIKAHNIDPDRVYLTGVSSGGNGAWMIGSTYAEKFAAVVPLCGGRGDRRALADADIPIWSFCNGADAKRLVDTNRAIERFLISSGMSPIYSEYHKSGHDCWNQAYRNKGLFEWLLQQSRSKNELESEKFRLIDKKIILQNQDLLSNGEELITNSSDNIEPIACGDFPHLIDYHYHTKFGPGQTLTLRMRSLNSNDELVLHLSYAVDGPATLTKNPGNAFTYISPRAQNQLDAEGWNDLRLRVDKDRVNVTINGFHALDQQLDLSGNKGWMISLEPTGPEDSEMRFRYLRWRPLTWLMSSTN